MPAHVGVLDDESIQRHVVDELHADPGIETHSIGVSVEEGIVTLSGTVEAAEQRPTVERAALRVRGVRGVANELVVRPSYARFLTDADIARDAVNAFSRDLGIPEGRVQISVSDGHVILHGTVDWSSQRVDAERRVRMLNGVRSVDNYLRVE